MNNNLLKIHNQYLKFVVTTNSKIPTILQNTGTVSIVHNPNDTANRNKLFIADEFIASGFGVESAEKATTLSYVADVFDRTTKYFANAYSYSLNYSKYLYDEINRSFVTNAGSVTSTYVFLDGYDLKLEDIRKILVPAEYDDIEFTPDSYSYVTYYCDKLKSTSSQFNTLSLMSKQECESNKCYDIENIKFDVPIGAHITGFYQHLNMNLINHKGVSDIKYIDDNDKEIIFETTDVNDTSTDTQIVDVEINLTHKSNDVIACEQNQILLHDYKIHNNGSDNDVKYPLLPSGVNIASTENKILDHYITCGDVVVNACPCIYYYETSDSDNFYVIKDYCFRNVNGVNRAVIFDMNDVVLYHNKVNYERVIVVALPIQYSIDFAYYRDSRDNFFENCTGDFYCMKQTGKQNTELLSYCSDNVYNSYKYDIYLFRFRTDAYIENQEIHLRLFKNDNENELHEMNTTSITNENNDTFPLTHDFVQNELYNTMHWLNADELPFVKL